MAIIVIIKVRNSARFFKVFFVGKIRHNRDQMKKVLSYRHPMISPNQQEPFLICSKSITLITL